jgi:hypothetical protein
MPLAVHQRQDVRLVDGGVGLGDAMGLEGFGRRPVLDEDEAPWLGRRVVDVELQTPGLRETATPLLGEKITDSWHVGRVADEDHDGETEHGGFLQGERLAYQQFCHGRSDSIAAAGEDAQIGWEEGGPVGK